MEYRKKPVVIEAVQWSGENVGEVLDFCNTGPQPLWGDDCKADIETRTVYITTPEGVMAATPGDWIIRGVKGEFYPCKPDVFEATYEPANRRHTAAAPGEAELGRKLIAWAAERDNAFFCESYTVPFCIFCGVLKDDDHAPDCLHLRARAMRGDDDTA